MAYSSIFITIAGINGSLKKITRLLRLRQKQRRELYGFGFPVKPTQSRIFREWYKSQFRPQLSQFFFFVLHVIDNWDQAFRLFLLKLSELLEKVIKQRPIRLAWEKPMKGAIGIKRGVRNSGLAKEKQCQAMLRKQFKNAAARTKKSD